jgi:AmiR/NasT family two-component response regulator
MKNVNGTPRLLRELRSLRVVVFHPEDQDGQELIGQLQRIGCQVKAFWPPLDKLAEEVDLVFLAVQPEVLSIDMPWLRRDNSPPVIAVVTYENPVIVEAVLKLNAYGIIASPVKSFGLLTSMVVAVNQAENAKERGKYVIRLEQRLAAQRKIAKAKAILMQSRNMSEEDAYNLIRNRAMTKRVTTEEIADAVIKANEILGFEVKSDK